MDFNPKVHRTNSDLFHSPGGSALYTLIISHVEIFSVFWLPLLPVAMS